MTTESALWLLYILLAEALIPCQSSEVPPHFLRFLHSLLYLFLSFTPFSHNPLCFSHILWSAPKFKRNTERVCVCESEWDCPLAGRKFSNLFMSVSISFSVWQTFDLVFVLL